MGKLRFCHQALGRAAAVASTLFVLTLACGPTEHKSQSIDETQTTTLGGNGTGGTGSALGGRAATSSGGVGGQTTSGSLSAPPCHPEDNTLSISTGDVLTDLPSKMSFSVFDPPSSKQFTGNGSQGDVRVYLPEPAGMDRIFRTATVVDPLDRESANIELVLASGLLNARYVVDTGGQLYAQVEPGRVTLTLCGVTFLPASDPPNLPDITVSGRVVGVAR